MGVRFVDACQFHHRGYLIRVQLREDDSCSVRVDGIGGRRGLALHAATVDSGLRVARSFIDREQHALRNRRRRIMAGQLV